MLFSTRKQSCVLVHEGNVTSEVTLTQQGCQRGTASNWGYKNYLSLGHSSGFSPLSHADPMFLGAGASPDWVFIQCSGFIHPCPQQRVPCSWWKILHVHARAHSVTVHWIHGNADFSCLFVGKPKPRQLSHCTQGSSFEHLLLQNTTFLFHQGFQDISCCRTLLFIFYTETKTVTHLVTREERESPVSGMNPEGRPGSVFKTFNHRHRENN